MDSYLIMLKNNDYNIKYIFVFKSTLSFDLKLFFVKMIILYTNGLEMYVTLILYNIFFCIFLVVYPLFNKTLLSS